jgi:Xaa-Pro aminopeptidase
MSLMLRSVDTIKLSRCFPVPSDTILQLPFHPLQFYRLHNSPDIPSIQKCAISNLHANLSFLDSAHPITTQEFTSRRDRLACALAASNVDAFALEPGYTFQYYANISQQDWEPWEPEERPFLMIIEPRVDDTTGNITAKTSFISPYFEEGRVRMLGIPVEGDLDIVTWEEHWNPYDTLRNKRFGGKVGVKIMVDEEMRDFLVRGLDASGFETVGLGGEIEAVRQIKSPAEVELLRAVNTGTVEAVRAMRPCLVPGLTEDEVKTILDHSLLSIGFSLFFNIVLFEENGALPHGGFATGGKVLQEESMVLIDVGAHYLGYSSDICRSFFIDTSSRKRSTLHNVLSSLHLKAPDLPTPTFKNSTLYAEKLMVWSIVLEAQTESSKMFQPNNSAASVDIAARDIISFFGYGKAFTHRVGHGIGVKGNVELHFLFLSTFLPILFGSESEDEYKFWNFMLSNTHLLAHESPYLNRGNTETLLRPGMTFTSEPGTLSLQFSLSLHYLF